MKNQIIICSLLFGLILMSCENKDITESEIKIGDYTDMTINNYDTVLLNNYKYPIDLNNDGISDIQFENILYGSQGVGYAFTPKIECLNGESTILVYSIMDTSFLHTTNYSFYSNNTLIIVEDKGYSYQRIDPTDSIVGTNPTTKVTALDYGTYMNTNEMFKSDTFDLFHNGVTYPIHSCDVPQDTCNIQYVHVSSQILFPMNDVKYIGVKFKNKNRLGWIKIILSGSSEISIIESGIQK